jgi:gamma-glutamyltranspeptidase
MGQVDYTISRWKKSEEKAQKGSALPTNPEGTNGLIAATTGGPALEAGLVVLKEGGSAVDAAITGDWFRQPELAETLRQVVTQGASYIYTGDWGRKFVAVVQREGGKITLEDMNLYHAIWREPLQTGYREFAVFTQTAWE